MITQIIENKLAEFDTRKEKLKVLNLVNQEVRDIKAKIDSEYQTVKLKSNFLKRHIIHKTHNQGKSTNNQ